MVYDANGYKSGCIDSITAGSFVIYDDERWRVARTSGDYVEVYRTYEAPQIVDIDSVELVSGGVGQ
ncbi:hypothetical protein [Halorubrum amylolyticum]|uniref:hypothetical protein n=1 Tax=Halorubrum amylolyticum TaxID=2508724 RepID=UPI00100870E7|nr:hypothetical protein [Halorubrum amylolyticum]